MVKFVSDKVNTSATIEAFLGQSFKDYSTYLDRAPIFVKYYSKDVFNSTQEKTLQAVNNVVGRDSPVKFASIENIPLYTVSQLDFNTSNDGFGNESDVSGDAIIIPETVVPKVDDFFILAYEKNKYTYRISDVNINKIRGNTYYRINFYLSDKTEVQLDTQVSIEKAVTPDITDNKKFIIVEKKNSLFLETVLAVKERLQNEYIKAFYIPLIDDLALRVNTNFFSDREVKLFIKKYNLLKRYRPMRNELFLSNNLLYDEDLYLFENRNSIFRLIEGEIEIDDFNSIGIYLVESPKRVWETIYHHPQRLYTAEYSEKLKENLALVPIFEGLKNSISFDSSEEITDWYSPLLTYNEENISDNSIKVDTHMRQLELFRSFTETNPIFNLIKLYGQEFDEENDVIEDIINSIYIDQKSLENFYLIPIVLFILDKLYLSKY